jgi:hypothetical protein
VSDVTVYHPGTDAQAVVPEEALPHLRVSGWLTLGEHNANQAEAEARKAEAAPAASSKTASKEK